MMTTEDLQKAATQKAEESVELLRSFYAAREHTKEFEPMPDVDVFFNLWGRTAGTACTNHDPLHLYIRLNLGLMQENTAGFLTSTIPHEVAHCAVGYYWWVCLDTHTQPHGPHWQEAMLAMGVTPRRTHNYNTQNHRKKYKRFLYACQCRTHKVTKIRHNRIMDGYIYLCRYCKCRLTYTNRYQCE